MVGKNNKFLKENKNNQRFLRFSLRKLSVGVVSVAIAAGFYIGGSQSVLADTTSTVPVVSQSTSNDNLAENTDKNTVNLQNSSTSTDPSAVASAADSTAAEAGKSAVPAAEQQKTATFNVAEEKPVAALNTANLLDNKAQSKAASDAAAATVNDDDLLKNIKISNPTDPKFVQYQNLVDRYNSYMSYYYGEEKPSQYVFSVIRDSRIDTDFIWTVDQDTGEKVSVYFNDWYRGITDYHQFIATDFDDNHNDYRYSKKGVTLSYDKPEGSSGSISVVDSGNANLQDVYRVNRNTDNSRYNSIATILPEKGQPIIKFLYRNPGTGKLMDLRAPIYYSNGLTGQKFELDIGDSYKQELKDMFTGFKLVGSSKASGTFTQFTQGKTYVSHSASDDSEVIYQQIDAKGTMKVFYREKDGEKQPVLDEYGNPCQLKAGSSIKIDTGNSIITAYNPFVTGDHAYELIYEPEDRNQVVNYVDHGKVIKSDTITGKITQTVDVTPSVPDHYELVPGQNIPSEVTLKDKNTPIIVKVQPKVDSITDPAKLNKSISRTITINKPGEKPQVINQTATFKRTGQHNEVTGEDVYTGWTLKDNTLEAVDAPAVPGYTPNVAHVDGVKNPTADTKLNDVVINYTADDRNQVVNYVDPNGKVVKTDTVKGKTDETVKVTPNVPDHYELVPGQNIPSEVILKDKNTPIIVKVQPKMDDITDPSQLTKAISRTITINVPHQTPIVENQSANFTRTGQHNEVTGKDVYTGWTLKDNTLEAVDAPAVPGYTPNVAHVDGVKNPTADTKLNDVVINYTADDRNQVVNYVDPNGKVVKTDTVKGKTDETVKVTPNVPDHYELVPGQNIPSEVTLKDKNTPIIVKVQPKMDDITDPSQLTKAISRTITINVPHQTPIVENQSANFTRTGQHNEVTGKDVYTGWTLKDNTLEAVDAPAVPGYTPNVAHVDGVKNPTADTKLNDVVINYTADDRNQVVNYVDPNGKVVKTDTVKGKTDETVKVTPNVPDHYELVPGQNIPSEVTLKDKNTPIIVKVQPKMDDITDPSQLTKAISRTITINVPHQTPIVENQSANFTRTGQHNEVTGKDVYTGWTLKDNTLEAVDAPAVPGYTPNVAHVDGVKNPTADTKLNDVVINYTADDRNQVVNYVDPNGKVVKTDTVKGKTDETVKVTPNVPDHYELVPGQNIPSEVTLKDKNTPIIVKVQPKMDDITDPSQLTKAISRTITINVPHQTPIVENQSANFTRTGQHNEVTGKDVYTGWTLKDNTLEAVDAPAVPGYTPNVAHVDGVKNPTADTKLNDVVINYTADDRNQVVNYVDPNGKVVKTDTVKGKTDETVKVTPNVPDHYELVPGQNIPSEVTLKDKNTPIIVKVQPKMDDITDPSQLTKAISRTITINVPHQTPIVENQSANFTRTGQHNEVTGKDVYTGWTLKDNTLEAVDAPAVPGYTPNVAHVDGVKNPTADTKLNDVVINYTADDRNQVVNYVDPNGKVVKTDTVKGKTDETVKVTPNVPDHYELVPGQEIPGEVKITDDNPAITVKVTPKMDPITDPAKLNKSISRTITINKPGEKPQVINQTATFKRTGKTNEVTGITTYTPWVLDQNGLITVSAPEVPGYTPSQKTVASVDNPTANTKLTDVTINYTANSQTTHINYVDKDGETVKSDTVSGKTDETVKTNSEVPAGWKITDGQIPETIHFTGEETPDTTITIEHDTTSVDHIKPVKPGDKTPSGKVIDGAHESDLNQTITRTINVTTPAGQTTTTTQAAKIYRDATIDDVTGEVTYGDWSEDTWADFKPGQIAGYTASPANVPVVTVKDGQQDQTVNITYTANEGTVQIKYVDRDGNEIGRQVITGHVGDTVKVTPQIPEDWVPVDPDTVPTEVQIKEENGQIIIVVIRHGEKDPVQTKNITRTIKVTTPDGQTKTIKQVATISRTGELDLVTGQITWQPWTTAQWDTFKPATIAGYTPSLAEVPAVTVDGETTDQTVIITYTPVVTPTQPDSQAPAASDTSDNRATDQKVNNGVQPEATSTVSQQTANAQQAESTVNNHRLPQTGNSHDASALAGLGLASLMGLFGLGGKRRKHD